jgi:hypothetical protein
MICNSQEAQSHALSDVCGAKSDEVQPCWRKCDSSSGKSFSGGDFYEYGGKDEFDVPCCVPDRTSKSKTTMLTASECTDHHDDALEILLSGDDDDETTHQSRTPRSLRRQMSDIPPCRPRRCFEMADDSKMAKDTPLSTQNEHPLSSPPSPRGLSARPKLRRTMSKRGDLLRAKSENIGGARRSASTSDLISLQGSITIRAAGDRVLRANRELSSSEHLRRQRPSQRP